MRSPAGFVVLPAVLALLACDRGAEGGGANGGQQRLAEQAQNRAEALDAKARDATAASEQAARAAAALARRVQDSEAALARADDRLAQLAAERERLARALAAGRLPAARLAAGLALQARRPAALALLQPASFTDTVRLRAVMASLAPQIEARTVAVRDNLARSAALERDVRLAAERRRMLARRLAAQRTDLAARAAGERLRAARAAGAADREAERALILAGRSRSPLDPVGALAEGDRRAARPGPVPALPPAYRKPIIAPRAAFATPEGTLTLTPAPGATVTAPAAGRIAFVGPYRGFGQIVILEHPGGWISLITGLGSAEVVAGQNVTAGSSIGRATGTSAPIGLELRRGNAIVPLASMLR